MANWRTTMFGIIAAAAGGVAASSTFTGEIHTIALMVATVATALLGFFAADKANTPPK